MSILTSVFGLKGVAIAVAVAFAGGTFTGGSGARIYYRGVIAAGQAAAARTDAKAADQLNESAGKTTETIATNEAHNESVTRDILKDMSKRSDDHCLLGNDGARGLLELQ